ncbi:MAG: hypothetical protein AAFV47_07625 [Pseudomonadota bacterium]
MKIDGATPMLRGILTMIEPSAAQKSAAAGSHRYVRRTLANSAIGSRVLRTEVIGSYARKTAIAPIDDIDVLLVLDRDAWPTALFMSYPDPAKVLADLQRSAKTGYPKSRVQRQRRSVGIVMARQCIDLVPALAIDDKGTYVIPDRKEDEWIVTAPSTHTQVVRTLNARTNGLFVPTIKLLKHWNSTLASTTTFKSIAIESIAGRVFQHHRPQTLEQALHWFFDFVTHTSGWLGPDAELRWPSRYGVSLGGLSIKAPDLSGVNGNVLGGVSMERAERFVDKARVGRDRLQKAAMRPTQAHVARQLGDLMKVDF